jgi:HAD superfamily hydrolase (TIGR01509 family)
MPKFPHPSTIHGIVFDCDGLLVDTEEFYTMAQSAIFERYGFPFGPDQQALLIGNPISRLGLIMSEHFGAPDDAEKIANEIEAHAFELLRQEISPLPGVVSFIQRCALIVPIAVASNSPRKLLDRTLAQSGLASFFANSISGDEVANPKPAPDIYISALALIGVEPDEAIAFEDSRVGATAAKAAGLSLVGIPQQGRQDIGADWHVDSLLDSELLAWTNGLVATAQFSSQIRSGRPT